MAAIDFPAAPTLNQIFSAPNGTVYKWNGTLWLAGPTSGGVATPTYDVTSAFMADNGGSAFYPGGNVPMQITMGVQVFSRAFTAVDATHPIEVDVSLWLGANNAQAVTGALFIDGAAASVAQGNPTINNGWLAPARVYWQGVLAAGPHTFSVRFAASISFGTLNGNNAGALGGGALRSTMTIREVGIGPVGPQGPAGPVGGATATPVFVTNSLVINDPGTYAVANADAVMQITQGTQIFSQVFTAVDPTRPIRVECTALHGTTNSQWNGMGLFIDGAPAAVRSVNSVVNTFPMGFHFEWEGVLAAGPHTFSVRFGGSGNSWINANSAVRVGGGAQAATLRITEVGVGIVGPQGPPGPTGGPVTAPTYDTVNAVVSDTNLFAGAGGDNVMQITNGTQLFTRSFTAVDATHPIEVDVTAMLGTAAQAWMCLALFIDGVAAAVAQQNLLGPVSCPQNFRTYWQGVLAAGAHVFSVRFGGTQQSWALTHSGVRFGGGAMRESMVIRELGVGPVGPQGPAGPQSLFLQSRLTQFFTPVAGTALIPFDNTPPLVGEGTALTSVTITPTAPTNRIRVTVKGVAYGSVTAYMIMAMFVGAAASANYSTAVWNPTNTGAFLVDMIFEYVPGTVALQTISLRYGPDRACTMSFNQSAGVGVFNGTSPLNILVEELTP